MQKYCPHESGLRDENEDERKKGEIQRANLPATGTFLWIEVPNVDHDWSVTVTASTLH
jgi:hypothetical protein